MERTWRPTTGCQAAATAGMPSLRTVPNCSFVATTATSDSIEFAAATIEAHFQACDAASNFAAADWADFTGIQDSVPGTAKTAAIISTAADSVAYSN